MSLEDFLSKYALQIVVVVVTLLASLLRKKKPEDAPAPPPRRRSPPLRRGTTLPAQKRPAPAAATAKPGKDPWDDARRSLIESVEQMRAQALTLAEEVEPEPANFRFTQVLAEWIPERAELLRDELAKGTGRPDPALVSAASSLSMVLSEVNELVAQRRNPTLLPVLADADRLADACYRPLLTFARAEGLPLSTAYPAARLSPFDLSIWTGFAPTSIAPLFLPPDFFHRLVRWPAIAHEVGHAFLVSVRGLEQRLRAQLDLCDEEQGRLPLRFTAEGLDESELRRLFGAWFEEIFCDVFGTLMVGPAYVTTMTRVFAAARQSEAVLTVGRDRSGRYDLHPPEHLRVFVATRVLDRAGLGEECERLWEGWLSTHGFSADEDVPLFLPVGRTALGLPFSAFTGVAQGIVEQLYAGPLEALSGMGLSGTGALDFGPREHQEALRAKASYLSGRSPSQRDARAVIGGAVLAWAEAPEREVEFLDLARAAISGLGTLEHHPDAYRPARVSAAARATGLDVSPKALVEALVLREVLAPRRPNPLAGPR